MRAHWTLLTLTLCSCQLVLGFEEHTLDPGGGGSTTGGGGDGASSNGCGLAPDGTVCDDGSPANGQCSDGICVDCTDEMGCASGAVCLGDHTCCGPLSQEAACSARCDDTVSDGCIGSHSCGPCGGSLVCNSAHVCVECLNNGDCADPTPGCDPRTSTCVECTEDGHCDDTPATPACNTVSQTCVECTADVDCLDTPTTPVCNTTTFTCTECLEEGDCLDTPATPHCDTAETVCVECTNATHCATSPDGPDCPGSGVNQFTCGCSTGPDCLAASHWGNDCEGPGGVCGCDGVGNDCNGNVFGAVCNTAVSRCGCNANADCGTGARGNICLPPFPPTSTCGCTGSLDCLGNSHGLVCNLTTFACQP